MSAFNCQAFRALIGASQTGFGTGLGSNILTAGMSIVYLRPVGAVITATATVVGNTKRQVVMRCELHSTGAHGNDLLVATCQGTATPVERG